MWAICIALVHIDSFYTRNLFSEVKDVQTLSPVLLLLDTGITIRVSNKVRTTIEIK